jgi:methylated-DNA-[protein]-cysteine S-methyltransferase
MPLFHAATFASPVGEIRFATDTNGALAALGFTEGPPLSALLGPGAALAAEPNGTHGRAVVAELEAYFAGQLREFTLPLAPAAGTPFQRRVWAALRRIPFGTTWSYARLADETASSPRAVGGANGANPLCLIVPCHRVIAADGSLGGYSGGLERKRLLLRHENAVLDGPKAPEGRFEQAVGKTPGPERHAQ